MARCRNLSWRSSSSSRSVSSGAITTIFDGSWAIWRSMSGSVPLPIEPNPIITIGPSKRACTGQPAVGFAIVMSLSRGQRSKGSSRLELGGRHEGPGDTAGRVDEPVRTVERARYELAGEQALARIGAGQPEASGLLHAEVEMAVIGRIADQQDRPMAAPLCFRDGMPHQKAPDAAFTAIGRHRQGAEQQSGPPRPGADAPQPDRADEARVGAGDE